MKQIFKILSIFLLSIAVLVLSVLSCPVLVYAQSEGVYDPDTSWWEKFLEESSTYLAYLACRVGAVVDHDFVGFVQARDDYKEWWNTGHISRNEDSKGNLNYSFDSDLMSYIKQCIDDYAKENEPYYLAQTLALNEIQIPSGMQRNIYDSMVNLLDESPSGLIIFGTNGSNSFEFTDFGHWFSRISPVKYNDNWVQFYVNETWSDITFQVHQVRLGADDPAIKTWEEVTQKSSYNYQRHNLDYGGCWLFRASPVASGYKDISINDFGVASVKPIISTDGRRIRVFNTYADFQNYTLGKRSVYYTKEYYSYVPEDLTASVDDLQQSVDGLSGVLDQLLGQITKDTDESEVEELLQQILDELKNQQGTGGSGGGSSGSDVNVNVDLSATNSWLSKIYAKVCEISDKINATFNLDTLSQTVKQHYETVENKLDDILKAIKRISFEASDDGGKEDDGVFDLDDMLKGILEDPETGSKEAADALSGSFGDVAAGLTKKFPISIPWDLYALFSVLADIPASPEQAVQFTAYDERGIMLDAAYTQGNIQLLADAPSLTVAQAARASDSPYFELPIYIESYGINETVTVDLDRFKPLSTFSRTLFAIIFGVLLLKWTVAFISAFNEFMPDFFSND